MSQDRRQVWWFAMCVMVASSIGCGPDPLVFENNSSGTMMPGPQPQDFGTYQPIDYGQPAVDMGGMVGPNNGGGTINDFCVVDSTECTDGEKFRTCIPNNAGGTQWSQPSFCPFAKCVEETGLCCDAPCPGLGEKRCGGGGVQTCEEQNGCLVWSEPEQCLEGATCTGAGVCEAGCQSTCSPGEQQCVTEGGAAYQRCEDIGGGCYQLGAQTFNCGGGAVCNNGECMTTCSNACSMMGEKQCVGTTERECVRGASGCLEWAPTGNPMACGPTCTDRCSSAGQTRCDASNNEQTCQLQNDGCLDWQSTGSVCATGADCYSSTRITNVPHGTCVQNAPGNTYYTCPSDGNSGCLWAFCNDGTWEYQCPQGNMGRCVGASPSYPHMDCSL